MKMKKITLLLLVGLLLFACVSCSSGKDKLIGTWVFDEGGLMETRVTFNKNGKFTQEVPEMGMKVNADYTVKGNELTIIVDGYSQGAPYSIKDDVLSYGGNDFVKVKKGDK